MKSLSSENQEVKIYYMWLIGKPKYTWTNILKDKKARAVFNGFIKIVNKCNRKPSKLWVNQGREFWNSLMQKCLDDNDILIYSTHNEGKSVVAEKCIRNSKEKN